MFDFSFFTLGAYGKCHLFIFCVFFFTIVSSVVLCFFSVSFCLFRFFLVLFLLVLSVSISFVFSGVCCLFFIFLCLSFLFFRFFEFGVSCVSLEKNSRFECAAHQLYDFGLCGPRGLRGPWDHHISQTFYTHLLPIHSPIHSAINSASAITLSSCACRILRSRCPSRPGCPRV